MAAMRDIRQKHPRMIQGGSDVAVSAANMAFNHRRRQEIQQLMQALAEE